MMKTLEIPPRPQGSTREKNPGSFSIWTAARGMYVVQEDATGQFARAAFLRPALAFLYRTQFSYCIAEVALVSPAGQWLLGDMHCQGKQLLEKRLQYASWECSC
jgi:hypothetical protein